MSIQIVYGTSGTGKSTYIFNQINEQIKQKSPYKIKVITPEQFSYTAEQKLLETSSSQSMISAEVITYYMFEVLTLHHQNLLLLQYHTLIFLLTS